MIRKTRFVQSAFAHFSRSDPDFRMVSERSHQIYALVNDSAPPEVVLGVRS
jgi:hypothetical protein